MKTLPAERRFVAVDPDDRSITVERGPIPEPRPGELLIEVSRRRPQPRGPAAAQGALPTTGRCVTNHGVGGRRRSAGDRRRR